MNSDENIHNSALADVGEGQSTGDSAEVNDEDGTDAATPVLPNHEPKPQGDPETSRDHRGLNEKDIEIINRFAARLESESWRSDSSPVVHSLQALFPRIKLDKRNVTWLWLMLKDDGFKQHDSAFGSASAEAAMAKFIKRNGLTEKLEEGLRNRLVAEEQIDWISPRDIEQVLWLQQHIRFDEDPPRNRAIPQCLSAYEQLIASIDISDDILRRKNSVLAHYRHTWYDFLAERRHHLKWFKGKESRAKVEFAWDWLTSHKDQLTKGYKPFTHYNDIQGFFTSVDMSYDEKELCVRKIKERWKSTQIAARHKTKGLKQCLFILPREIDGLFQEIVDRRGQTRVQVMEDLIKEAAKREFQPESTT